MSPRYRSEAVVVIVTTLAVVSCSKIPHIYEDPKRPLYEVSYYHVRDGYLHSLDGVVVSGRGREEGFILPGEHKLVVCAPWIAWWKAQDGSPAPTLLPRTYAFLPDHVYRIRPETLAERPLGPAGTRHAEGFYVDVELFTISAPPEIPDEVELTIEEYFKWRWAFERFGHERYKEWERDFLRELISRDADRQ
jgi:hypothetical protein